MKRPIVIVIVLLLMMACGQKNNNDLLADSGRTERTENLLASMKKIAAEGNYMFGHHDATVYGVGWVGDSARSDVKSVCGDLPAVVSFDLSGLETDDNANLGSVGVSRLRQEIIRHFDQGGVVSLSWHAHNPITDRGSWVADSLRDVESKTVTAVLAAGETHEKFMGWLDRIADFLNSLETPYGVKVPVIFRPWHEHTGSWFWWGQDNCTADEFKALWRLTVERLKERGVVNALYAYSTGTEPWGDKSKYMERYPGDDIIDLLGLDCYCNAKEDHDVAVAKYKEKIDVNLSMLCELAKERDKVAAVTETGYEGIPDSVWWTETLAPALAPYHFSYVLMWRNAHDKDGHFFAPYPGQQSTSDFVKFYNDKKTLFLHDLNGIYLP